MSSSADARLASHFRAVAGSYDRMRPADDRWWEVFERIVAAGDLDGRRTLDVGCGTGTFAAALADRGAKVWGIDASTEMLAQTRAKGSRARFKEGSAEALPFKDGWFERVVMRLSLQHVDRSRALAEAARVLVPGGRIVIASFDPKHFSSHWLSGLFPSLVEIDEGEYERGLAAAEAQIPEELEYRLEWLVVAAEAPPLDAVRTRG